MFPESFVEAWIERIVPERATVLDPFCGRGTAPFQALLMGREAVACDVNPVAYCVTRAKTNAPRAGVLRKGLTLFEKEFESASMDDERLSLPEFFRYAFCRETLNQILYLRRRLKWTESDVDCMLAALILGSLHGESSKSGSYFSNQMPRTISPKPAYSVRFWKQRNLLPPKRDVFRVLRDRIGFRYASPPPERRARVFLSDMRELPYLLLRDGKQSIRHVITSPPYFDITNFEEDQWLRLWFLGNDPKPTYGKLSGDDRHSSPARYWDMICDLWRSLGQVLDSKAHIVLRIGAKGKPPKEMAECLLATSLFAGRKVRMIGDFEVSLITGRQTDAFRPGSKGCLIEVDYHFGMA